MAETLIWYQSLSKIFSVDRRSHAVLVPALGNAHLAHAKRGDTFASHDVKVLLQTRLPQSRIVLQQLLLCSAGHLHPHRSTLLLAITLSSLTGLLSIVSLFY